MAEVKRLTYCILGTGSAFRTKLGAALRLLAWRARLRREGVTLRSISRSKSDVIIYCFDPRDLDVPGFSDRWVPEISLDPATIKILVQFAGAPGQADPVTDRRNAIIESIARRTGASNIATRQIARAGSTQRTGKSGQLNVLGFAALASAVLRTINARALRGALSIESATSASDTPVPSTGALLDNVTWDGSELPESLTPHYTAEAVLDFADRVVSFAGFPSWGKIRLGEPIDWATAGANWSWQSYYTGLEFIRTALCFWFDWRKARKSERTSPIVRDLANRGLTPDDVLHRALSVMADFVRENPPSVPKSQRAYFQGTIIRRVKAYLTLLICARAARDEALALDHEELSRVSQSLIESFEMLRREEVYPGPGNHGLRQDMLFVAAGLVLGDLCYGKALLDIGLQRLEREQLKHGLSADGVWLENSYGYHCLVMNQLVMGIADLRTAKMPCHELENALDRMLVFAEAMMKVDGWAPLIGDTAPLYAFGSITDAQRTLARSTQEPERSPTLKSVGRSSEAYLFDAGYFASHTNREMDPRGSSVLFFANLSRPKHKQADDLSLIFSHGAQDLLVDGGTYNKEISDAVRNAARHDPATHNTFRVNGVGYPMRAPRGTKIAGITGKWQGAGWTAARGFNAAYPDGAVERFVVHLKDRHALIVLDRLTAKVRAPVLFEQFWHIHPDFVPREEGSLWTFTSQRNGILTVSFDAEKAECAVAFGSPENPIAYLMLADDRIMPTPYIRRARLLREGAMASLFQWSEKAALLEIAYSQDKGRTEITARGAGFNVRFAVSEKLVECLSPEAIGSA